MFYRIMSSHFIWNAYFESDNLGKGDAILAYYENSAWDKKIAIWEPLLCRVFSLIRIC